MEILSPGALRTVHGAKVFTCKPHVNSSGKVPKEGHHDCDKKPANLQGMFGLCGMSWNIWMWALQSKRQHLRAMSPASCTRHYWAERRQHKHTLFNRMCCSRRSSTLAYFWIKTPRSSPMIGPVLLHLRFSSGTEASFVSWNVLLGCQRSIQTSLRIDRFKPCEGFKVHGILLVWRPPSIYVLFTWSKRPRTPFMSVVQMVWHLTSSSRSRNQHQRASWGALIELSYTWLLASLYKHWKIP